MVDVTCISSPEAKDADVIYAVGDIHGRLDLLIEMEEAIADDIRRTSPRRPVICYLGDYVDRGPSSAGVIEHLVGLSSAGGSRVFLKGNHEDRLLAFLDEPAASGPRWMDFGGREALESYGVIAPAEFQFGDWATLRDAFARALPGEHLRFFQDLRLGFAWRRYLFVHAGLDPSRPAEDQTAHDLMWIRDPFLKSDRDWGVTVVHGHVIVGEPEFKPNRIAIDTGAYKSGRLTCLVASAGEPRVIAAGATARPGHT